MNVESNGSHFLVGRSSPPPNPDLEMGQTSGRTRSQGGSPMPRNSMQGDQIRPGPQVFVTPSAMHTGQRVFGGRAGTIGAQRGAQASLSGSQEALPRCQRGAKALMSGAPQAYSQVGRRM